jgi:hypothetical protein
MLVTLPTRNVLLPLLPVVFPMLLLTRDAALSLPLPSPLQPYMLSAAAAPAAAAAAFYVHNVMYH